MKFLRPFALLISMCALAPPLVADDYPSAEAPGRPLRMGSVTFRGSMRIRSEAWNWFRRDQHARYAYGESLLRLSVVQQRSRFDWKLELAQPSLFGLPHDGFAPTGEPLGLGATYFATNQPGHAAASAFLKQGYISFKGFGSNGSHLRLGRFDFSEGLEARPPDDTLAALKRHRLADRLISGAGDTPAGRSFDGLKLSYDRGPSNISFLAARPTEGVYQVRGMRELDINLTYSAFTQQIAAPLLPSELRLFAAGYHDGRHVLKADNRPLGVRQADSGSIRIGTFGGHFISAWKTPLGKWDALLWGAIQTGSWGALKHRANSIEVGLGWHPPGIWGKPWLRASAFRGSGDHDSDDLTHGTFFPILPTDRQYSRIPFYNFQNTLDFTGQLMVELHRRLKLHSQIHKVKLADKNDLWYTGTGAFQNSTFGYEGTATGDHAGLANYLDLSLHYQASSRLRMTMYVGAISGKAVMTDRMQGRKGGVAYLELLYHF